MRDLGHKLSRDHVSHLCHVAYALCILFAFGLNICSMPFLQRAVLTAFLCTVSSEVTFVCVRLHPGRLPCANSRIHLSFPVE